MLKFVKVVYNIRSYIGANVLINSFYQLVKKVKLLGSVEHFNAVLQKIELCNVTGAK